MIRKQFEHHQLASYTIVAAGAVLLVIATVLISNPTSITFRSEAQGENEPSAVSHSAQASTDLPVDKLPECVKRISYIAQDQDVQKSCLVSIQCKIEPSTTPQGCSLSHGVASCYRKNECMLLTDWITYAQTMCGCS